MFLCLHVRQRSSAACSAWQRLPAIPRSWRSFPLTSRQYVTRKKWWTPEEVVQLQQLRQEGHRPASIAKQLGRSTFAVRGKLHSAQQHNAHAVPRRMHWTSEDDKRLRQSLADRVSVKDIAIKLNRTIQSVNHRRLHLQGASRTRRGVHQSPEPWAREELDRMKQLRQDGNSCAAIARALGRPYASVRSRLSLNAHHQTRFQSHLYSQSEDELLRKSYSEGASWKAICAALPHRSYHSLNARASALGIARRTLVGWTDNEMATLFRLSRTSLSWDEISAQLPGRTKAACVAKLRYPGIHKTRRSIITLSNPLEPGSKCAGE